MNTPPNSNEDASAGGQHIDPQTGLPLPDPFPDYITCPLCGEAEVEVWCYQAGGVCHNCGEWVKYDPPSFCGVPPFCKRVNKDNPGNLSP